MGSPLLPPKKGSLIPGFLPGVSLLQVLAKGKARAVHLRIAGLEHPRGSM